jgi:hypothetical protein
MMLGDKKGNFRYPRLPRNGKEDRQILRHREAAKYKLQGFAAYRLQFFSASGVYDNLSLTPRALR